MTVEQRKDSKWYCRFQINGERIHRLCPGAKNKKEALEIENGLKYKLQQQQNGIIPREDKKRCKLKQLSQNFLKYSMLNRKTYAQDKGRIRIIFEFFDENRCADTVVRKDVEEFKLWLLNKGRAKKTVNLFIGILRIMYNLGIANEWVSKNPFSSNTEFKLEPYKAKYLADDSQQILLNASPDFYKPIIITALNSGLRRDNIRNLKWSDLDFNFRTIEIVKNKGNKHIKLPMTEVLYNLFMNMERVSEYVFVNPNTGRGWSNTKFGEMWRKIREKAGLSDFKFHGLRHTVATRLIKKNVPPPIVKEVMTHSDLKTTMQYVHIDSLDVVNAIQVLNSYN